jgi:hypothetical protein
VCIGNDAWREHYKPFIMPLPASEPMASSTDRANDVLDVLDNSLVVGPMLMQPAS